MNKCLNKITAFLTVVCFAATQLGLDTPSGFAAAAVNSPSEVNLSQPFHLTIPSDLGTIESLEPGQGAAIVHIQEAHGNYEGQKKIQALLHYLKDQYGFNLILLEGNAFRLKPELVRFFPDNMDLTMEIVEELAKKHAATGPELFLAKENDAAAFGIENLNAYVRNGSVFKSVLEQRNKSEGFLRDIDLQIKRLTAPYLNASLREFLSRFDDFELGLTTLEGWLAFLKGQAEKHLEIDLEHPAFQIDWPMLLRIFTLKRFESKLDLNAFQAEREEFLKAIRPYVSNKLKTQNSKFKTQEGGLFTEINRLLSLPLSESRLPDPETGLLFESMIASLPADFDHGKYPNVKLFIGHLILQSELKADRLFSESDRLANTIAERLAKSEKEKEILLLMKDYRLLKKLFALELTPEEYEEIERGSRKQEASNKKQEAGSKMQDTGCRLQEAGRKKQETGRKMQAAGNKKQEASYKKQEAGSKQQVARNRKQAFRKTWVSQKLKTQNSKLKTQNCFPPQPSQIAARFLEINAAKRVRDIAFTHLDDLDSLFAKALDFYRGAKARDEFMLDNIEKILKAERGTRHSVRGAVIITGGFHSGPFQEYFKRRGYQYALISPKITTPREGRETYVDQILKSYRGFQTPDGSTFRIAEQIINEYGALIRLGFDPEWVVQKVVNMMRARGLDSEAIRQAPFMVQAVIHAKGLRAGLPSGISSDESVIRSETRIFTRKMLESFLEVDFHKTLVEKYGSRYQIAIEGFPPDIQNPLAFAVVLEAVSSEASDSSRVLGTESNEWVEKRLLEAAAAALAKLFSRTFPGLYLVKASSVFLNSSSRKEVVITFSVVSSDEEMLDRGEKAFRSEARTGYGYEEKARLRAYLTEVETIIRKLNFGQTVTDHEIDAIRPIYEALLLAVDHSQKGQEVRTNDEAVKIDRFLIQIGIVKKEQRRIAEEVLMNQNLKTRVVKRREEFFRNATDLPDMRLFYGGFTGVAPFALPVRINLSNGASYLEILPVEEDKILLRMIAPGIVQVMNQTRRSDETAKIETLAIKFIDNGAHIINKGPSNAAQFEEANRPPVKTREIQPPLFGSGSEFHREGEGTREIQILKPNRSEVKGEGQAKGEKQKVKDEALGSRQKAVNPRSEIPASLAEGKLSELAFGVAGPGTTELGQSQVTVESRQLQSFVVPLSANVNQEPKNQTSDSKNRKTKAEIHGQSFKKVARETHGQDRLPNVGNVPRNELLTGFVESHDTKKLNTIASLEQASAFAGADGTAVRSEVRGRKVKGERGKGKDEAVGREQEAVNPQSAIHNLKSNRSEARTKAVKREALGARGGTGLSGGRVSAYIGQSQRARRLPLQLRLVLSIVQASFSSLLGGQITTLRQKSITIPAIMVALIGAVSVINMFPANMAAAAIWTSVENDFAIKSLLPLVNFIIALLSILSAYRMVKPVIEATPFSLLTTGDTSPLPPRSEVRNEFSEPIGEKTGEDWIDFNFVTAKTVILNLNRLIVRIQNDGVAITREDVADIKQRLENVQINYDIKAMRSGINFYDPDAHAKRYVPKLAQLTNIRNQLEKEAALQESPDRVPSNPKVEAHKKFLTSLLLEITPANQRDIFKRAAVRLNALVQEAQNKIFTLTAADLEAIQDRLKLLGSTSSTYSPYGGFSSDITIPLLELEKLARSEMRSLERNIANNIGDINIGDIPKTLAKRVRSYLEQRKQPNHQMTFLMKGPDSRQFGLKFTIREGVPKELQDFVWIGYIKEELKKLGVVQEKAGKWRLTFTVKLAPYEEAALAESREGLKKALQTTVIEVKFEPVGRDQAERNPQSEIETPRSEVRQVEQLEVRSLMLEGNAAPFLPTPNLKLPTSARSPVLTTLVLTLLLSLFVQIFTPAARAFAELAGRGRISLQTLISGDVSQPTLTPTLSLKKGEGKNVEMLVAERPLPKLPVKKSTLPIPLSEIQDVYPRIQTLFETNRPAALRQLKELLDRIRPDNSGVTGIPAGEKGEWNQFFQTLREAYEEEQGKEPARQKTKEKSAPPAVEQKKIEERPVQVTPPPQRGQAPSEYRVSAETILVLQKSLAGVGNYIKEAGVHKPTGAPQDSVQIDITTGRQIGNPANYGAPSKDGTYLPVQLHNAERNSMSRSMNVNREDALRAMLADLTSLRNFQISGEGREVYAGQFPWNEYFDNGTRRLALYAGRRMVPSLDNGQTTFAIAAVAGALWNSKLGTLEKQVRDKAVEVLDAQNYGKMVSRRTGLLFAEWNLDTRSGYEKPGHASLWTEWAIPQIWALWTKKVTMNAWLTFPNGTWVWNSPAGPLDMPEGYIYSGHEWLWIFQYLSKTIMKSKLAPLYQNYLYLSVYHAQKNNVPGLVATEYHPNGQYTQGGIDATKYSPDANVQSNIGDERMATPYATAMAALVNPRMAEWVRYLFEQPGVVQRYGPVTSFTRKEGASAMHTADNTFSTANALAELYLIQNELPGGINDGIIAYFKHRYGMPEADLIKAFDLHAEQILKRLGRTQFRAVQSGDIPLPPAKKDFSVEPRKAKKMPQETMSISERLNKSPDWRHGANVSAPSGYGSESQQWAMRGGEIIADYDYQTSDKRYAWLGTTVEPPFSVAGAAYVSFWVPTNRPDEYWELEFKNSKVELAPRVRVVTNSSGVAISPDGKWKRIVLPVWFKPELVRDQGLELNYFAISTNHPKAKGRFHIRDIRVHKENPVAGGKLKPASPEPAEQTAPTREPQAPAPRPTQEGGRIEVNERGFKEAQRNVETMKTFVRAYMASKGYRIADEGWLSGFSPWYSAPLHGGRSFREFQGELNDSKLRELERQGFLERTRSEMRGTSGGKLSVVSSKPEVPLSLLTPYHLQPTTESSRSEARAPQDRNSGLSRRQLLAYAVSGGSLIALGGLAAYLIRSVPKQADDFVKLGGTTDRLTVLELLKILKEGSFELTEKQLIDSIWFSRWYRKHVEQAYTILSHSETSKYPMLSKFKNKKRPAVLFMKNIDVGYGFMAFPPGVILLSAGEFFHLKIGKGAEFKAFVGKIAHEGLHFLDAEENAKRAAKNQPLRTTLEEEARSYQASYEAARLVRDEPFEIEGYRKTADAFRAIVKKAAEIEAIFGIPPGDFKYLRYKGIFIVVNGVDIGLYDQRNIDVEKIIRVNPSGQIDYVPEYQSSLSSLIQVASASEAGEVFYPLDPSALSPILSTLLATRAEVRGKETGERREVKGEREKVVSREENSSAVGSRKQEAGIEQSDESPDRRLKSLKTAAAIASIGTLWGVIGSLSSGGAAHHAAAIFLKGIALFGFVFAVLRGTDFLNARVAGPAVESKAGSKRAELRSDDGETEARGTRSGKLSVVSKKPEVSLSLLTPDHLQPTTESSRSEIRSIFGNLLNRFLDPEQRKMTTHQAVETLANEYGLMEPNPFAYSLTQEDLNYWTAQGLSRKQLRQEFETRKAVRDLASKTKYQVAGPSGRITAGDLSWWAEQLVLLGGSLTESQLRDEFTSRRSEARTGDVLSYEEIQIVLQRRSEVREKAETDSLISQILQAINQLNAAEPQGETAVIQKSVLPDAIDQLRDGRKDRASILLEDAITNLRGKGSPSALQTLEGVRNQLQPVSSMRSEVRTRIEDDANQKEKWEGALDKELTDPGIRFQHKINPFARRLINRGLIPPKAKILSLGAWRGRDEVYFAKQGHEVTATDFVENALTEISKLAANEGVTKNVQTQVQDLRESLNFADSSFDVAYAHLSLHYFDDAELNRIIHEIKRVLIPGGKVFLSVRSVDDWKYQQAVSGERGSVIQGGFLRNPDERIQRFFSRESLSPFFNEFEAVSVRKNRYKRFEKEQMSSVLELIATKPTTIRSEVREVGEVKEEKTEISRVRGKALMKEVGEKAVDNEHAAKKSPVADGRINERGVLFFGSANQGRQQKNQSPQEGLRAHKTPQASSLTISSFPSSKLKPGRIAPAAQDQASSVDKRGFPIPRKGEELQRGPFSGGPLQGLDISIAAGVPYSEARIGDVIITALMAGAPFSFLFVLFGLNNSISHLKTLINEVEFALASRGEGASDIQRRSEVREEIGKTLKPVDSVAAGPNHNEASQKILGGELPQNVLDKSEDLGRRKQERAEQNYTAILREGKAKDVSKVRVAGNQNERFFANQIINFLVRSIRIQIANIQYFVAAWFQFFTKRTRTIGVDQEFHGGSSRSRGELFFARKERSVQDAGANIGFRHRREFFLDFLKVHPPSQSFKDNKDRRPGAPDAGFPSLLSGRDGNVSFKEFAVYHPFYLPLTKMYHILTQESRQSFGRGEVLMEETTAGNAQSQERALLGTRKDLKKLSPDVLEGRSGRRAETFSNQALVNGNQFPEFYDGSFGKSAGSQAGRFQEIIDNGNSRGNLRRDGGHNNIFPAGIKGIRGNHKSRSLLERREVSERKWDKDNVPLLITSQRSRPQGYSRSQKRVQLSLKAQGHRSKSLKGGAGPSRVVSDLQVPPLKSPARSSLIETASPFTSPSLRKKYNIALRKTPKEILVMYYLENIVPLAWGTQIAAALLARAGILTAQAETAGVPVDELLRQAGINPGSALHKVLSAAPPTEPIRVVDHLPALPEDPADLEPLIIAARAFSKVEIVLLIEASKGELTDFRNRLAQYSENKFETMPENLTLHAASAAPKELAHQITLRINENSKVPTAVVSTETFLEHEFQSRNNVLRVKTKSELSEHLAMVLLLMAEPILKEIFKYDVRAVYDAQKLELTSLAAALVNELKGRMAAEVSA